MDEELITDFEKLIKSSAVIGYYLSEKKIPSSQSYLLYAEGLAQKVIYHTISAYKLHRLPELKIGELTYDLSKDFSSIAILTRAALESYLTFNHIFSPGPQDDEFIFRLNCWNLGGFIDRKDMLATTPETVKLKEDEQNKIAEFRRGLEGTKVYLNLTPSDKKKALNGNWKLSKTWTDLAVTAGYGKTFFSRHYRFLCSHSHASRLSISQIRQAIAETSKEEIAHSFLMLLMLNLAKFLFDYINIIPHLKFITNDETMYSTILEYKEIAENMKT